MKKKYLIIIVLCVLIGSFNYFSKKQNILRNYSIPTASNEPAIPLNSYVLVSSFGKIKKNNFLVFLYDDPLLGEIPYLFRLIATPGDTVQIKKGIVYVNNINIDQELTLKHFYKIRFGDFYKIEKHISPSDYIYNTGTNSADSLLVFLNDNLAKENNFKRVITSNKKHNTSIEEKYDELWNKDKFGPLIIPNNKYFVLGDNRDNANDSRYIGLIDKTKILGIVILGDNNE